MECKKTGLSEVVLVCMDIFFLFYICVKPKVVNHRFSSTTITLQLIIEKQLYL